MEATRKLYAVPEARTQLGGMSHSKFYDLVKKKHIATVKIGRRTYVTGNEIDDFIEKLADAHR